jgi:hypothetical protein
MKIAARVVESMRGNKLFAAMFLLLTFALLVLHSLLPSMQNQLLILGYIKCISVEPSAIVSANCPLIGWPAGGIMATGAPIYIAGGIVKLLLHIPAEWALFVTACVVMFFALYGAYKLIAHFKVDRAIALGLGFVYLSSLTVLNMHQFGGTYWGTLVLPAALYVVLRLLENKNRSKIGQKVLIVFVWTALATTQLFLDGYTFFMTAVASSLLLIAWTWRSKKNIKGVVFVWLTFVFAYLAAYGMYKSVVGFDGLLASSPINFFRAFGTDVATLFLPSHTVWWANVFDIGFVPSEYWGDGSNSVANYIGYVLLACALVAIYKLFAKRGWKSALGPTTLAFVLISAVSFIFALGPSVKINDRVSEYPDVRKTTSMPADAATITLPTEFVYQHLPGFSSMRAPYRWNILLHVGLVVLAGIGIQNTKKLQRKKVAVVIIGLMLIEASPNPFTLVEKNLAAHKRLEQFDTEVVTEMQSYTNPGELVIFYPSRGNDYLANYIAPQLRVRTYNVGNDKAYANAKLSRPEQVHDLLFNPKPEIAVQDDIAKIISLLESGTTDAVIVPYFELRWSSYLIPASRATAQTKAEEILARADMQKDKLQIERADQFAVLRLKK